MEFQLCFYKNIRRLFQNAENSTVLLTIAIVNFTNKLLSEDIADLKTPKTEDRIRQL